MIYHDNASGETFEFRYIVTQTEDEGPERLEYRVHDAIRPDENGGWKQWPEDMPVPSEVNAEFFGETVDWDFDVPGFFDAFSMIRAAMDELWQARNKVDLTTNHELAQAIVQMRDVVGYVGDLDEPYALIAEAALKNEPKARGQLERLAKTDTDQGPAKDRDGKKLQAGDIVRLVQGELGFLHEIDVDLAIEAVDGSRVRVTIPPFETDKEPSIHWVDAYDVRKQD